MSDRSTVLAVELVRAGARLVVVGGTARRLLGRRHRPRDLDVVVGDGDVPTLVGALSRLGVVVSAARLHRCRDVALASGWGPLDVFVREALPSGVPVEAAGRWLVARA